MQKARVAKLVPDESDSIYRISGKTASFTARGVLYQYAEGVCIRNKNAAAWPYTLE
jgi:hypothetical protein